MGWVKLGRSVSNVVNPTISRCGCSSKARHAVTRAASRLSRRGSRANDDVGVVSGKASVTDGPYVEMKEKISGLYVLEARDLNHAIRLMSKHPVVRAGGVEIRALADPAPVVEASREPGRGKKANPARSQRFRVVAQQDGPFPVQMELARQLLSAVCGDCGSREGAWSSMTR